MKVIHAGFQPGRILFLSVLITIFFFIVYEGFADFQSKDKQMRETNAAHGHNTERRQGRVILKTSCLP